MKAFRPLLPFLSDKKKTILFLRGKTRRTSLFSGSASLKSKIYLSINYGRNPTSRGLRADLEFLCSNARQKAIKDYQSSWLLGSQLNAKQSIGLVQSLRLIYSQSTSRIPIPFPPMRLFASIPR